jgi:WD40 repeat protein
MTPPGRARQVYLEALDVPTVDRPRFLDDACAGDTALRAEVENLLGRDECAEREVFVVAAGSLPTLPDVRGDRRVGARLGPYEVKRRLAEGGMGAVYLAERWRDYRQLVAIKFLKGGLDSDEFLLRFRTERQALAGLQHPNIARLLDGGSTDDGVPYLVMEYVEGEALDRHCDGRRLDVRGRLGLFLAVCEAVEHAHCRGIIHRDLKPANVLVTADGTPKVMDFGLAKHLQSDPDGTAAQGPTRSGAILGTPGYLAPEQGGGLAAPVGPATDVYALGALLYHLVTGRPPFRGDTPLQAVLQGLRDEPLRPSRLHPGLPGDVETICLKCLEKQPARRYPGAADLADDVRRFLAGEPIRARPAGPAERALKWARRRPAAAALVLALVVAGAAGLAGTAVALQREHGLRRAAEASELRARRYQHAAEMNLAQDAWSRNQGERTRDTLLRLRPPPGGEDLRTFAWRHFWYLCNRDVLLRGHAGTVTSLAFSPDGTLLASCGVDHAARLWDAVTQTERAVLRGHGGSVTGLAFSPDGALLATTCEDGVLRLWDARTGRERARSGGEGKRLTGVAFAPDGKTLATAGDGLQLKLWDPGTARELTRLEWQTNYRPEQSSVLACVAFTPDGKTLAAGGWNDGMVRLWDVAGRRVRAAVPPTCGPYFVAFAPDGRTLLTNDREPSARLADADTGAALATLEGHRRSIRGGAFSPDGKLVATASSDGTVKLWDRATCREVRTLADHTGRVVAVAFSPDGKTLASGGDDGVIHLDDPTTGRPCRRPAPPDDPAWAAQCADQLRVTVEGPAVGQVTFSADGRSLAIATQAGVWLIDPQSGREVRRLSGMTGSSAAAALSPDGRLLAAGGNDHRVYLWDAHTGERLAVLEGHALPLYALAFSPDGRTLASAGGVSGMPAEVKLWDVAGRRERASLPGDGGWVRGLAFSPDGRTLATGCGDGSVRLWDVAGARLRRRLAGHTDTVYGLAFSPDGRTLASGGADAAIKLWDPADGRERLALHGHVGAVLSLAFAPDGRVLASCGNDGTVKLWDGAIDRELVTLPAHEARANTVAFSPDGTLLASGGFDGVVNLWYSPRSDE